MSWWHPSNDAAASEVVGFVLVTGISVAAITIVLLSGGPALEQVRSSQQHDAMVGYFHDFDQAVSQILSGAPKGSTPVWRVSMSAGSISVQDDNHTWAYAVDKGQDGLWYGNFSDGDHSFNITKNGSGSLNIDTIKASAWDGAWETELDATNPGSVPADGSVEIKLTETGVNYDISGHTVSVTFYSGPPSDNPPFARVWFVDAGAVTWEKFGAKTQRIHYENSALISDIDEGQVLHNTPRIQPPEDDGDQGEHIFIRMLRINGSASFGGRQTAEILVSSEGNHPRHSSPNVTRIQLYPPERTSTVWERYLTNCPNGFTFTWKDDATDAENGSEPVAFRSEVNKPCPSLTDPERDDLAVTMVETGIKLQLRGGA